MAARPVWKGYLKLSLVTCAVELSAATSEGDDISFHVVNRATGNRVRRQYVDAESGRSVAEKDQVNGYEIGDGEFLLVEEDEIEAVQIESSHTLSLGTFVESSEIEKIYLDKPYYLTPADDVSEEAFAVIRESMADRKMAGLARIVLFRRERPALIEPFGRCMLLTTLRYDRTVRKPDTVFDDIEAEKADPKMVKLARDVIEKKMKKFDPSTFVDPYQEALHEFVEKKKAGRKPAKKKAAAAERPSNVVNLFDALKRSLGTGKAVPGGRAAGARPKAARKKPARKQRSA